MKKPKILAVIPARGGSKGLPKKNIRPFAGIPLIHHSILFARMCPEIHRCVVSTDSPEIRDVCREVEADVPFHRPMKLATDETPLWPVLQHALGFVENNGITRYDLVLLLDPTSPGRHPEDVTKAVKKLLWVPDADGLIAVSKPDFHPLWTCVVKKAGWMSSCFPAAEAIHRRQDAPRNVFRINGSLYLWRAEFVRRGERSWRESGRHLMMETPEGRALSIDTLDQFRRGEALVHEGFISLPWLRPGRTR